MKRYMAIAGTALPLLDNTFDFILLSPDESVYIPVQSHADMILTVFDGKLFCHMGYYEKNRITIERIADYGKLKIVTSESKREERYPLDVGFNALVTDKALICRRNSICPELAGYPIINTRQGYAGCTALYAADTVITADASTISACKDAGIPVFEISGKDILLPGYNTGFIGGACGVCEDTVYIYGTPETSESGRELKLFCEAKGLRLVSLYQGPVTDVGGIKFIEKR